MNKLSLFSLVLLPYLTSSTWISYPSINLMNGCGMVCNNNGPYICLGTFTSYGDCQNACNQNSKCTLLTWSSGTGNCWTRTDNFWDYEADSSADSGCLVGANANCVAPTPPYNGTNITFTVDTLSPVMTTHPLSPAVTLDFWRSDDPTFGIKWGNSSAINIDVTNPLLRNLTALLGPGLLRLGGSPEDSLVYDSDGTCVPGSGGNGPAPNGYYCSQVHPYTYDCLTPKRWQDLLNFAESTGMQIAMGLNGCYGRMSSNTSMDFTNVQALLQDTVNSPFIKGFWGLELSNEVVPNTISPYIWGQDATTIHTMAANIFKYKVPMVGPDQGGSSPIADVAKTTTPGTLAAFTYHQYPECTAPAENTPFALTVPCLFTIDTNAQACVAASQSNGPNPAGVWAGETADHSGGGIFNLTDTFRSSFYYAYQLGALPVNGVELGARQTLSGGAYSLLQVKNFQPNPDFFILWFYRSLIGGSAKAYDVTSSLYFNYTGVRVFVFSANPLTNARYTLLAINLRTDTGFALSIQGNDFTPSNTRTEYHLTGDINEENGTITCNGTPLVVNPQTNLPPSMSTLGKSSNGNLLIGPSTIVYATIQ